MRVLLLLLLCAAPATARPNKLAELAELAVLRGARRAQQEPPVPVNSMETVAPTCAPGYFDISQGKAFYWSCAFYCEGGKYYATSGCLCACLTPLQAAKLLEEATRSTAAPTQEATSSAPAVSHGTILVTSTAATTQAPVAGVTGFPVGDVGAEHRHPSVDQPPPPSSPISPGSPGAPAAPAAEEEPRTRTPVETVVLVAAAALLGLCALAGLAACWAGLGRRPTKDRQAPAITLYKPRDSAPEPTFELNVPGRPSSRASSKSSTGSQRALVPSGGNSRSSSRESAGPLRDAAKAADLDALALATASTNASNYSGVGSVNSSWAWGLSGDGTGSRHLSPQRPRAASHSSTGSRSARIQPETLGERRASDSSGLAIRELEVPSWRRPSK